MTRPTRSATCRTTDRSCATEQVAQPQLALQLGEQVQHPGLHRDVEGGHRLVEHQQRRLRRQRAGDPDALALPAGERRREPVDVLRVQTDQRHQLVDPGGYPVPVGPAGRPQRLGEDVADRHARASAPIGSWNTIWISRRSAAMSLRPAQRGDVGSGDLDRSRSPAGAGS
nr:hypothetical protein [Pseudonocardia sp. ICBG601]